MVQTRSHYHRSIHGELWHLQSVYKAKRKTTSLGCSHRHIGAYLHTRTPPSSNEPVILDRQSNLTVFSLLTDKSNPIPSGISVKSKLPDNYQDLPSHSTDLESFSQKTSATQDPLVIEPLDPLVIKKKSNNNATLLTESKMVVPLVLHTSDPLNDSVMPVKSFLNSSSSVVANADQLTTSTSNVEIHRQQAGLQCQSLSDSCLQPVTETTNLNALAEARRSTIHKVQTQLLHQIIKDEPQVTDQNVTPVRDPTELVDDLGLSSEPQCQVAVMEGMVAFPGSLDCSPLSTPPPSLCNSTAWSGSANGSDSWEDLRTESQVMCGVSPPLRYEIHLPVTKERSSAVETVVHEHPPPLTPIFKRYDSEDNVWRTLRDQARATLSPPLKGRTIETQIPVNWPPRHGLSIQKEENETVLSQEQSSSSNEEIPTDGLAAYMHHSITYSGNAKPHLVEWPSVELIEGTLLAKWCKKDNRTWLWKSSRRRNPRQNDSNPTVLMGSKLAKHWKKDNRTWLWKSSRKEGLRITEIAG